MSSLARLAAGVLVACWVVPAAASGVDEPRTAALETQVLEAINHARQNPRALADELRDYRRYFDGRVAHLPGEEAAVVTQEGTDAIDEAIGFLERQAPLPPLDRGTLLALAARDHAEDQGAIGAMGHVSRDGASPGERVRRRGGDIYVGETISYGHADAGAVLRQLVIDDGVPGRGHRKLLFGTDFRFAGVGCSGHRRFGHMCVVDLSASADGGAVLPEWARARGARLVRTAGPARPTEVARR